MHPRSLLPILVLIVSIGFSACSKNDNTVSGMIVFSSNRDGNNEIYVMNADGSQQTRLTTNEASDTYPQWSMDGTKIFFISDREAVNGEIYVMDADGSNPTRLTQEGAIGFGNFPLSPDGSKIAYTGWDIFSMDFESRTYVQKILVMNTDGSEGRLIGTNQTFLWASRIAWSSDSQKITFCAIRDGTLGIYTIDTDGSNETLLSNQGDFDFNWSLDGKRITFFSFRDGDGDLYVMNADGSGQTRLTNNNGFDFKPIWSPDGSKILFFSERDGTLEIYVMNADGSRQTRLTNNQADENFPAWSPDGQAIAYIIDQDGNNEIFVMSADGSWQTNLTNNSADDDFPTWAP